MQEHPEVVQQSANIDVRPSQGLLAHPEGASIEGLRLSVTPLLVVEAGELLERLRYVRMAGAELTFGEVNNALGDGDCLAIPSGSVQLLHSGVQCIDRLVRLRGSYADARSQQAHGEHRQGPAAPSIDL
jgi:hypothetical protein